MMQLSARDQAILAAAGRYRILLRAEVRNVFGVRHPGPVLQRLREGGLIIRRDGLGGRVSYYQLTQLGAAGRVPVERTEPLGERALGVHLAVLWFSLFAEVPRIRLEEIELAALFGEAPGIVPQVAYCADAAQLEGKPRRVYRVFVPGEATATVDVLKRLRREIADVKQRGGVLAEWLQARSFAFAVLVDSPEWRRSIRDSLGPSGLFEQAHFTVVLAPRPRSLRAFLDAKGEGCMPSLPATTLGQA